MKLFPELAAHRATATRLHPRLGAPSATDSSVGGPLLWPVDEPWPVCADGGDHAGSQLRTPATVHRIREIYAAAQARATASGDRYTLTDEERAEIRDFCFSEPHRLVEQPIPLVPVAQLYQRDVPDFAGPENTDLLQVLWCPLDHPDQDYNPRVRLFWRNSADVTQPLDRAPEPPVVTDDYLPEPCVVHPEQVVECQYCGLLPEELYARITAWEREGGDETGRNYEIDLSLALGWKVGGFANWSLTDPYPANCAECDATMTLLFTAASFDCGGMDSSWRPVGEPTDTPSNPPEVTIGRGYDLFVFRCPASFDHPPAITTH
jgi:hypothetical protein